MKLLLRCKKETVDFRSRKFSCSFKNNANRESCHTHLDDISIYSVIEPTGRRKNIRERELGKWSGTFLVVKGAWLLRGQRGPAVPPRALPSLGPVNG